MERRLAAVLFADVAGYTRLMERDEAYVLAMLQEYRRDILEPLVLSHGGKILKLMGDGVLIEFNSAVNAVECAVNIQARLNEAGKLLPTERRILMRIGINLGDVMVLDGDIYGGGVNIASRLQELAEPGEIWLSEDAYRQVHSKVSVAFDDLGPKMLKNLAESVRAFRVAGLPNQAVEAFSDKAKAIDGTRKPTILVLPFTNLSGELEQEYFCHGLTNDITTELSRFSGLSVVSATTALAYKGKPLSVREASKELGAQYVLEGSVQKLAARVRVNVQLIDARGDQHIWAERFDREIADLFVLQDEIIEHVVGAMALKVEATERVRAIRTQSHDADAYDLFMRGAYHWLQHSLADETRPTLIEARRLLEASRAIDPAYARTWAWLSLTYVQEWRQSWAGQAALDTAGKFARMAYKIDPDDYQVHWMLAYYHLNLRHFELALSEYETAIALNQNEANLLAEYAEALVYVGERHRGLEVINQAIHMNPLSSEWYRADVAWILYLTGDYEAALAEVSRISNPNADARLIFAACHGQLASQRERAGDKEQAMAARRRAKISLRQIQKQRPHWTIAKERKKSPFKSENDAEHWLDGLRSAGLPERDSRHMSGKGGDHERDNKQAGV